MSTKNDTSSSFQSFDVMDSSGSSETTPTHANSSFDDIALVKVINKAKFPVLLGTLPTNNENFAVKLFPYKGNKINHCFLNEMRFSHLRHKNVIPILHCEPERQAAFQDCDKNISYTIMELAPFGDFCEFVISRKIRINDKLARTYFQQFIEGLEYLHSAGVAHLDLKPDNLLLSSDYTLKIGDFDQAHIKGQGEILSKGTLSYRAPEIVRGSCKAPEAADIYSAGIILFLLKCGGVLPYSEDDANGMAMFDLMVRKSEGFWERHCEFQKKTSLFFDEDFKALFNSMISFHAHKRSTIENIKKSNWYNGPVYTQEELSELMQTYTKSRSNF